MRKEIFSAFCRCIWTCPNRRRIFTKSLRFAVEPDLKSTELGQIFDSWSVVEFYGFRPLTSDTGYACLIRQKINNLYTKLFDEKVILHKEYLDCLKVPKTLYYAWRGGQSFTPEELTERIDKAMACAQEAKNRHAREKMKLPWSGYKVLVENVLEKAFSNCRLLEEFESNHQMLLDIDCWNEDNFYVRYLCRSLEGELRKYQKKYYGVRDHHKLRRCRDCGKLYEVNARDTKSNRCRPCYNVYRKSRKTAAQSLRRRLVKSEQKP